MCFVLHVRWKQLIGAPRDIARNDNISSILQESYLNPPLRNTAQIPAMPYTTAICARDRA